jgi:hypothetical protein
MASEFSKEERARNRRDLEQLSRDRRALRKETTLNTAAAKQALRDAAASKAAPSSKRFANELTRAAAASKHLSDAEWRKEMDRIEDSHSTGFIFTHHTPLSMEQQAQVDSARKAARGGCAFFIVAGLSVVVTAWSTLGGIIGA